MADTSMQGQKDTEKISVQKTFDIELSKHVMNKGLEHDKSYEIQGLDHGDCIDDPNIVDEGKDNKDGASIMFIQKLNSSLRIRVKEFLLINWFKLLVIILMVTGSSIVKYGEYVQKIDVEKPYDIMHQLLLPLNLFAMENPGFRDVWIATTSFLLDLQFFFVMINWFKDGYSMRTPISVLMFYGIRAVIQQLYILPFPEHMYWEDPGFPWLLNIYGRQSDFFYSGHIGFCLLCLLENMDLKAVKSAIFWVFGTIFVGFTLLTFRVHYTIDIFTGLVMAHYWFITVGKVVEWFDLVWLNQKVRNLNPNEKAKAEGESESTNFRE